MKKYVISIIIVFILAIMFLAGFIITNVDNPIVSNVIKADKNMIVYKIRNISLYTFYYGMGFSLQRKENNNWVDVEVKNELLYTAVAKKLSVLGTKKFTIKFEYLYGELESGQYCIRQNFKRESKDEKLDELDLFIFFDI